MSVKYKGKEIKYIASDLDGTLLFGEGHKLDDETYELISKCVDKGILFIVASGRTYENELTVMEPIKDKISYIGGSGTICVHKNEMVVYHTIDQKDANKIYDVADSIKDCFIFICTDKGNYANSNHPLFFDHLINNVQMVVNLEKDLRTVPYSIEKISAFYETGSKKITSHFKEAIPHYNVVTSGPQWIDFLQADVNKGTTLKAFLNTLGIDPKDGIAFGDQENDIEMIQTAGTGYCMKTGVQKAKDAADYVIESPKEILKEILNEAN